MDALSNYADAIAAVESAGSGGYSAVGPAVKGDRAYGRYQVMGSNVPSWTQAALGRSMTPQEFLSSPQAQDAVFRQRFGGYVNQYGNPQDAASVWFSGRPLSSAGHASDGYIDAPEYVRRFNSHLGGAPAQSGNPQMANQPAMPAAFAAAAPPMQQAMQQPPQDQQTATVAPVSQTIGDTMQRMAMWGMAGAHPEVLNSLGQTQPDRKFVQIGTDEFGNPRFGFVDPRRGTVTPAAGTGNAATGSGLSASLAQIKTAQANGANTQQLLAMAPAGLQADLSAMIGYKAVPSNLSRSGPVRTSLLALAHSIDPSFDETQLPARIQFNKDLTNPNTKIGGQFVKQGTALQTLANLAESGVGLGNSNGAFGLDSAATVANALGSTTTAQAAKIAAFENQRGAYVGEKGQLLYPGTGGTHEERSAIAAPFSSYGSPAKLADALQAELANEAARSDALQQQIDGNHIDRKVVTPQVQANIDRVNVAIKKLRAQAAGGSSPSSAAPTITGIKQIR